MEERLNQISATVMIVGSLLFLGGAVLPVSSRVYPQPSPVKKLESINAAPGQWFASQVLFALGTVVTVVGIALYAFYVRQESFAWLAWVSVGLLTVAAAPWLWQVYARAADPSWFAKGMFPMWPYLFYFIVTEAGLAVFGVALVSSPLPSWVGWVVVVSMFLFALLTLVFRDMIPLVFYVVTLFVGVMLLV